MSCELAERKLFRSMAFPLAKEWEGQTKGAHVGRHHALQAARGDLPARDPLRPGRVVEQREAARQQRDGVGREARVRVVVEKGADNLL